MDVRTFLENPVNIQVAEQEVSGWLVTISNELYLLEEKLSEDYKNSMKIKISDKSLMYAIRKAILPLGGGESFVFHKAKLIGFVRENPLPEIVVKHLFIQERGQNDMIAVDISESAIEAGRKQYDFSCDFLREMGG